MRIAKGRWPLMLTNNFTTRRGEAFNQKFLAEFTTQALKCSVFAQPSKSNMRKI